MGGKILHLLRNKLSVSWCLELILLVLTCSLYTLLWDVLVLSLLIQIWVNTLYGMSSVLCCLKALICMNVLCRLKVLSLIQVLNWFYILRQILNRLNILWSLEALILMNVWNIIMLLERLNKVRLLNLGYRLHLINNLFIITGFIYFLVRLISWIITWIFISLCWFSFN